MQDLVSWCAWPYKATLVTTNSNTLDLPKNAFTLANSRLQARSYAVTLTHTAGLIACLWRNIPLMGCFVHTGSVNLFLRELAALTGRPRPAVSHRCQKLMLQKEPGCHSGAPSAENTDYLWSRTNYCWWWLWVVLFLRFLSIFFPILSWPCTSS